MKLAHKDDQVIITFMQEDVPIYAQTFNINSNDDYIITLGKLSGYVELEINN